MSTKLNRESQFWHRLLVCVFCTGILMLFFAVSLATRGPRIRKLVVDVEKVATTANQTIVLHANQPIKELDAANVRIQPAVDFSLNASGESIVLLLKQRLQHDTTYTLEFSQITSLTGRTTSYRSSFTTAPASYYYLQRHGVYNKNLPDPMKQPDEVVLATIGGKERVVYSAHHIVDYGYLGDAMVIHQIDFNNQHRVALHNLDSGRKQDISLPDIGRVTNLAASPNGRLFGFTMTSDKQAGGRYGYAQRLFVYDRTAQLLVMVRGIGEDYVDVMDWKFAPDGTSVLAQTYKSGVTIFDTFAAHEPIPLGAYIDVGNFSRTGSKVVLNASLDGIITYDLATGTKQQPVQKQTSANPPYIADAWLLQNSDGLLKKMRSLSADGATYSGLIVHDNGQQDTTIFQAPYESIEIGAFGASRNDQYITVETSEISQDRTYDNYPEHSKPKNIQTRIMNIRDGTTLQIIDGFRVEWR